MRLDQLSQKILLATADRTQSRLEAPDHHLPPAIVKFLYITVIRIQFRCKNHSR